MAVKPGTGVRVGAGVRVGVCTAVGDAAAPVPVAITATVGVAEAPATDDPDADGVAAPVVQPEMAIASKRTAGPKTMWVSLRRLWGSGRTFTTWLLRGGRRGPQICRLACLPTPVCVVDETIGARGRGLSAF